ncbi:MAG: hypothetical protein ACRD2S_08235, partial [Terriglobales bacterium]
TELSSRFLFPRISTIQRRIVSDHREVMAMGKAQSHDLPDVLLVGNSLLLHGVDYPRLREGVSDRAEIIRYGIENTEYLDWYYGLRRLFAEGVRPSTVILCLNLGQTLSHGVLDESARRLIQASDLLKVSREAGMDTTKTSGFVIAHWSDFYAYRATIRNYIINKSDPPYASALHALARRPPTFPSNETVTKEARHRLADLRNLCRENGAEFVLLVPPALSDRNEALEKAAILENIEVETPVTEVPLTDEFFLPDRFHLNERGQKLFTDALLRDLQSRFRESPLLPAGQ